MVLNPPAADCLQGHLQAADSCSRRLISTDMLPCFREHYYLIYYYALYRIKCMLFLILTAVI